MAIITNIGTAENSSRQSLVANEDLSSSKDCFVSLVASASANAKVGLPTGEGTLILGVLQNEPESGEYATVQITGQVKVKAAEAVNSGIAVQVTTAGKVKAAASGDFVAGYTLTPATAADELVIVLLQGTKPQLN